MFDIQNFIDEVKCGRSPYDVIAQHYWEMSRDDLGIICKEFIFEFDEDKESERINNVLENLEDFINDEY